MYIEGTIQAPLAIPTEPPREVWTIFDGIPSMRKMEAAGAVYVPGKTFSVGVRKKVKQAIS